MSSNIAAVVRRRRGPKRVVAMVATLAGIAAICATLAPSASAEPTPKYPVVGSDTIQYVDDAVIASVAKGLLGSYDAVDPLTGATKADPAYGWIQTQPGAQPIARPGSSGDGWLALNAAKTGESSLSPIWTGSNTSSTSVALSRASSARGDAKDSTGTDVGVHDQNHTFVNIPYTVDAISVAKSGNTSPASPIVDTFTLAQLKSLYSGQPVTANIPADTTSTPASPAQSGTTYWPLGSTASTEPSGAVGSTSTCRSSAQALATTFSASSAASPLRRRPTT